MGWNLFEFNRIKQCGLWENKKQFNLLISKGKKDVPVTFRLS